jgi:hypothetical protein
VTLHWGAIVTWSTAVGTAILPLATGKRQEFSLAFEDLALKDALLLIIYPIRIACMTRFATGVHDSDVSIPVTEFSLN